MIEYIKKLLRSEGFLYLFFGGVTTVINYVVYFILTQGLGVHYLAANAAAWAAAVAAAFITNKIYVFRSEARGRELVREIWQFVSARIVSGVMESALMWIFVDIAGLPDGIVKIAVSVLVVLLNYIFSKLIIFRKK